jgi:hypothetical protein
MGSPAHTKSVKAVAIQNVQKAKFARSMTAVVIARLTLFTHPQTQTIQTTAAAVYLLNTAALTVAALLTRAALTAH